MLPLGLTPVSVANLVNVASEYENICFAYLSQVLSDIANRDYRQGTPEPAFLHSLVPMEKAVALEDVLEAASCVPTGSPEEPGLLPLLFLSACISDNPDQIWMALHRVKMLAANFGLGNMHSIHLVLQEIWTRRVHQRDWNDWRGLLDVCNWDLLAS